MTKPEIIKLSVILFFILASCHPVKKAIKTFNDNKKDAAEYCAEVFPVKDVFIKGDTVTVTDTLWGAGDTILTTLTRNDTIEITKTFPPKIITKTVRVVDTIIRENTARVKVLENTVLDCQSNVNRKEERIKELLNDYEEMKASRNKLRLWFWILVGAIGMFTFLKVKKILPF